MGQDLHETRVEHLSAQALKDPLVALSAAEEAAWAGRVQHRHVVGTRAVTPVDGEVFVVREPVAGVDLATLLSEEETSGARLALPVAVALAEGALRGLQAVGDVRRVFGAVGPPLPRRLGAEHVLVGADGVVRLARTSLPVAAFQDEVEANHDLADVAAAGRFLHALLDACAPSATVTGLRALAERACSITPEERPASVNALLGDVLRVQGSETDEALAQWVAVRRPSVPPSSRRTPGPVPLFIEAPLADVPRPAPAQPPTALFRSPADSIDPHVLAATFEPGQGWRPMLPGGLPEVLPQTRPKRRRRGPVARACLAVAAAASVLVATFSVLVPESPCAASPAPRTFVASRKAGPPRREVAAGAASPELTPTLKTIRGGPKAPTGSARRTIAPARATKVGGTEADEAPCAVPFHLDGAGIKHYKVECL